MSNKTTPVTDDQVTGDHTDRDMTTLGLTCVAMVIGGAILSVVGAEMAAPVLIGVGLAIALTGTVLKVIETFSRK